MEAPGAQGDLFIACVSAVINFVNDFTGSLADLSWNNMQR